MDDIPILSYDDSGDEAACACVPPPAHAADSRPYLAASSTRAYSGSSTSHDASDASGDCGVDAAPTPSTNTQLAAQHSAVQDSRTSVAGDCCTASGSAGSSRIEPSTVDLYGPRPSIAPTANGHSRAVPGDRHVAVASKAAAGGSLATSAATAGSGLSGDDSDGDGLPDDPDADFEAKRRRAVFTAMLVLLEHGARDVGHLSKLVAPMSGEELQQVAEERALAGRCGNPLCRQPHALPSASPRRRWDPAVGFIEPPPPSHYCSAECESVVQSYAAQLGDPMERLKPGVRQLLAASHKPRPGMEDVAAQGGGVPTMMAQIQERDPKAAAAAAVAGGKALDKIAAAATVAAAVTGGDGGGSAATAAAGGRGHQAVEGYVPAAAKRRSAKTAAAAAATAAAPDAAATTGTGSKGSKGKARQVSTSTVTKASSGATAGGPTASASGAEAILTDQGASPAATPGPGPERTAAAAPSTVPSADAVDQVVKGGYGGDTRIAASSAGPEAAVEAAPPPALKSSLRRGSSAKFMDAAAAGRGDGAGAATGDKDMAKRVTFGPQVEYQLPPSAAKAAAPLLRGGAAVPSPAEQPVLVFDVDGEDGDEEAGGGGAGAAGARGRGPAMGPRGTLRVAEAAEVLQGDEEAGAASGAGLTDEDLAAAMQERAPPVAPPTAPRALRMWFPPAAGGIGVSRRAGAGAGAGAAQRRPQPPHPASAAAAAAATTTAVREPSSTATLSAATRVQPPTASEPSPSSSCVPPASTQAAASAAPASSAATASTEPGASAPAASPSTSAPSPGTSAPRSGGIGGGGGLRRFLPQAPPRRKVVYLDRDAAAQAQPPLPGAPPAAGASGTAAKPAAEAVAPGRCGNSSSTSGGNDAAGANSGATASTGPSSPDPASPSTSTACSSQLPCVTLPDVQLTADTGSAASGSGLRPPASPHRSASAAAATSPPASQPSRTSPSSASASAVPDAATERPTDPWAPWAPPPPGSGSGSGTSGSSGFLPGGQGAGKVHVIRISSGKRPPGGGVPIPPECQPYFPEEEEEEEEEEEQYVADQEEHDDRDADEVADDLYAGTLRAVDDEAEEEEREEAEGRGANGSGRSAAREEPATRGSAGRRARTGAGAKAGPAATAAAAAAAGPSAAPDRAGSGGSWWKEQRRRQQQQQQEALARQAPSGAAGPSRPASSAVTVTPSAVMPPSGPQAPGPSAVSASVKPRHTVNAEARAAHQPAVCASPSGDQHDVGVVGHPSASRSQQTEHTTPRAQEQDSSASSTAISAAQRPSSPAGVASSPPAASSTNSQHEAQAQNDPGIGVQVPPPTPSKGQQEEETEESQDPDLEDGSSAAYPLRDDLDTSSEGEGGSDDDDAASNASSTDDYNFKSMLPYFRRTTQHYHTVLSPYNQVQTALVGWVNSRTVAFVVGVGLGPLQDPGPPLPDVAYAAEAAEGAPPAEPGTLQARGVLLQLLSVPVRDCCASLGVRVAQSDVDRKLAALVGTFRLSGPVPSFKPAQWHLLSLALLHALSRHHIPALRASMSAPVASAADGGAAATAAPAPALRAGGGLTAAGAHPRLLGMLERIGFDVHYLASLVDLLVSPEF